MLTWHTKKKYGLLLCAVFCVFAVRAHAATLSLVPQVTSVSVGNIISVSISTNTEGKAINNAEATIEFPKDLLDVVSVTKNNSIFTLWVEEPQFSNNAGRITFNGGAANPGYTGNGGSIATVTFRAKQQGVATVVFSDAAVRQNDGLGTNILTKKNQSTITIGIPTTPAPAQPMSPVVTPAANALPDTPVIFSNTHPHQDKWYTLSTASFGWSIPARVTKIQAQANKTAASTPATTYDTSVSEKTFTNLSDGTYYMHLRYANSAGWSPVAHYRVNIDTTAPLAFTPTIRTTDTQQYILLDAEDSTSGIEYYTVQIDNAPIVRVARAVLIAGEYPLPILTGGEHTAVVTAYDKAGNHTSATVPLVSPSIEAPTVTVASADIQKGDPLVISGSATYPGVPVEIILTSKNKELYRYTQTSAADGTFSMTTDKIDTSGVVTVRAISVLSDTVQSPSSEKVYVQVHQTKIASITVTLLWIVFCLGLILVLIILVWVGWHKYLSLRKVQKKKLGEIAEDAHRAIMLLKQELHEQLAELEEVQKNRALNKEEERIFKDIQKNISDVDAFLEKKLTKLM